MKKKGLNRIFCFVLTLLFVFSATPVTAEGDQWVLYDVRVNASDGQGTVVTTDGEQVLATDSVTITVTSDTAARIDYSYVGETVNVSWELPPSSFSAEEDLRLSYSGNEGMGLTHIMGGMYTNPEGVVEQRDPQEFQSAMDRDFIPYANGVECYVTRFRDYEGPIYYVIHITGRSMASVGVDVVYEYRRSGVSGGYEGTVDTDAGDSPGEDESSSVDIPTVAVVGGGVAAGTVLLRSLRKKKAGGKEARVEVKKMTVKSTPKAKSKKKEMEEKAQSTFRMILYKEFGDTLIVGEKPRSVYARIEELTPEGGKVDRPDLTARIRIFPGEHIKVLETAMAGNYMGAVIEAEAPDSGVVSFAFSGEGGRIQNNVRFKIEGEGEIIFADEGITFVAGEKQSFVMPFIVKGMGDPVDISATMEMGGDSFDVSVNRGEAGLWLAELREKGRKTMVPGGMEEYTCTVVAARDKKSVTGSFSVYRYHEGLRLNMGALKCYSVAMGDLEKEILTEDSRVKQTPAHTRVELTLYTWDEESGELRNPIPEAFPQFTFEDVVGSDLLADLKGDTVEKPCEMLKFTYMLRDVILNNNTLVGEIYPTGGILIPPNRSRAVVTARVEWEGREFTAKQEVTLTSQTYREKGDNKTAFDLFEQDDKYTENLRRIQKKILWDLSYSELRPMAHKIELMLRGYSSEYGYYMPDYQKILSLYESYTTGELGSVQANKDALSWKSIIADGMTMTLTDFNESGKGIAGRIVIGMLTTGASELVFLPVEALHNMKKYVDQGGDSALEGFVVGVKTVAVDQMSGAVMGKGIKYGAKGLSAGAKVLKKGAEAAKKTIEKNAKELVKGFSSAKYGKKLLKSTEKISEGLKKAKVAAEKNIIKNRRFIEESVEELAGDEAFVVGRREGLKKIKELRAVIKRTKANTDYSKTELREFVLAVQQDKHAMHQLKESLDLADEGLRARFNREMAEIYDEAIMGTRKRLARKYNIPIDDIQVAQASGNSDELAKLGKSVGMDKDVTFRIKTSTGMKDISEDIAGEAYNAEFFRTTHGGIEAADPEIARRFAQLCDQSVVSDVGRESYGTWEDLQRVLNKKRAGEAFDDVNKVASTVTYKSEHWFEQAEQGYGVAREAAKQGDRELARYALSNAEAMMEEGVRQSTKQFDRIVIPRVEFLDIRSKAPDLKELMEKMEVLKKIGLGTHGSTGITIAEARVILKRAYNTTIEEIVKEAEEAVIMTNSLL